MFFEAPINPDKRLAICLYLLARGDYLYTIGEMVRLEESTVCQKVVKICTKIHFPKTNDEFKETLVDMDAELQFPYAFATFDGSHLSIKCPSGEQEAMKYYYNFKNFYTVILLGLVDINYRFIWATLGALGFQSTSLWDNIASGKTLSGQVVEINDLEIPQIFLDDSAFPLQSWMMKSHGDAVLTK